MLSLFYITPYDKNIITTSEIFPQIDKILARESFIKNFWKDDSNQNSIWAEVAEGGEVISQIIIRFDTKETDSKFIDKIKDFAYRNKFHLTIKQEVSFSPEKLNEEVIKKNTISWTIVDDPKEYLENQKIFFTPLP